MSNAPLLSMFATGTIEPSRFVTLSAAADYTAAQSGTGEKPIGVSQEWSRLTPLPGAATRAATTGEEFGAYGVGQVCYLECGTAIVRADYLKPDTNGKAIKAAGTDYFGAQALASGAVNTVIRVLVQGGKL